MLQPSHQFSPDALQMQGFALPDLILVGEPAEAKPKLSPGAEVHSELDGGPSDEALYRIAQTLLQDGNYELAEPLLERLFSILAARLENDHPALAKVAGSLAVAYLAGGKFDQAESHAFRALTVYENRDDMKLEMARTLNNLASVYNSKGDYQSGEFCLRRAFGVMENLAQEQPDGIDDSDLLPILENFCLLLRKTGRETEAALLDARIHGGNHASPAQD